MWNKNALNQLRIFSTFGCFSTCHFLFSIFTKECKSYGFWRIEWESPFRPKIQLHLNLFPPNYTDFRVLIPPTQYETFLSTVLSTGNKLLANKHLKIHKLQIECFLIIFKLWIYREMRKYFTGLIVHYYNLKILWNIIEFSHW